MRTETEDIILHRSHISKKFLSQVGIYLQVNDMYWNDSIFKKTDKDG